MGEWERERARARYRKVEGVTMWQIDDYSNKPIKKHEIYRDRKTPSVDLFYFFILPCVSNEKKDRNTCVAVLINVSAGKTQGNRES